MYKKSKNNQLSLDFGSNKQGLGKIEASEKKEPKIIRFQPQSYYPPKVSDFFNSLSNHVLTDL